MGLDNFILLEGLRYGSLIFETTILHNYMDSTSRGRICMIFHTKIKQGAFSRQNRVQIQMFQGRVPLVKWSYVVFFARTSATPPINAPGPLPSLTVSRGAGMAASKKNSREHVDRVGSGSSSR
jgi:hypothetical protein